MEGTYTMNGEEINPSSYYMAEPGFALPKPNYNITFHRAGDNGFIAEEVGHLDFNGQAMKFEGDFEESAKVFFDFIARSFAGRLKEEYQRGYEDCLTEEVKK
jgi:hypothetical protein